MSLALLTINHNDALCENSRASMLHAAHRWDADFFEVTPTRPHDWNFPIAPNALKCAVFERTEYDEVLILDADVLVAASCPNPFTEFTGPELIAVANGGPRFGDLAQVKSAEAYEVKRLQERDPRFAGVAYDPKKYFNTGMMLARRAVHAEMFKLALEVCHTDHGLGWCDQTPINLAALLLQVPVRLADERWNYIHGATLGPEWQNRWRQQVHILHFAGEPGRELLIPQISWK